MDTRNMFLPGIDFSHRGLFVDIFKDRVFLVGGTVRDFLISGTQSENRDVDIVVEGYSYAEIESLLRPHGRTGTVGRSFAVIKFTVDGITYDVSIPRQDIRKDPESSSHRNFDIRTGPHIPLSEDLKRRDFTCNSIALRLSDNRLVDLFNGVDAIGHRRIVMTGPDTFCDDPLRILRCARFASVLGFSVEPEIYRVAANVELKDLSRERVQEELVRLLLESHRPSRGLHEYFQLGILSQLFPELERLALTIQDAEFHPETDEQGHHTVWAHTRITVDVARRCARWFNLDENRTLALLLGALLHDVGKAVTTVWRFKRDRMTVTSRMHDSRGVEIADGVLERLCVETRRGFPLRRVVLNLVRNHHRIYELYRNREAISYKTVARLVKDLEGEDFLLVLLDFADRISREKYPLDFSDLDEISRWILKRKEAYNLNQETIRPLVMGRHLMERGVKSGRGMGKWLERLYERQLNGEFSTLEEGLALFDRIVAAGKKGSGS